MQQLGMMKSMCRAGRDNWDQTDAETNSVL